MAIIDSPIELSGQGPEGENGAANVSTNGSDQNSDYRVDGDILHELLVSGLIYPADANKVGVEVRRGMRILSTERELAGTVAAVINVREVAGVKYILLSRPSREIEYRMVPIELVQQVTEDTVQLDILAALVNSLPAWGK